MATVSYSDLESLAGEFLPPRTALSLINISYVHNTYTTNEFHAPGGGGGNGSSVAYACQENASPEGHGGPLGLFASPAQDTVQCIPAVVGGR